MKDEDREEGLEAAMERLERIVSDLEKGEFSLQEALDMFEEGLRLGKHCKAILDRAEMRVKKLVESEDGQLREEELDGEN